MWDLALSPNGTSLAAGCEDGSVRIFDVDDSTSDGLTYRRAVARSDGRVLSVAWSPDSTAVCAGAGDGIIRCCDATTGKSFFRITVESPRYEGGERGGGRERELLDWK